MISHSHLVHMATKLVKLQGGLSSHKVIDQVASLAFLPLMIPIQSFCTDPLDFNELQIITGHFQLASFLPQNFWYSITFEVPIFS